MSILFPTQNLCYMCKEKSNYISNYICSECRDRLEYTHREVDIGSDYIVKTYYSVFYNRFIKELVHRFKFNNKSYLYKPLAEIMLETIDELDIANDIDLILYVPIHRRKEAIRGYNQSELLAMFISNKTNKPLSKKNLIKHRWTREQNQLKKIERKDNLKDSFKIKNPNEIINKRILLIDDIITTGATFDECGKILKNSGAREVVGLALTSSKA